MRKFLLVSAAAVLALPAAAPAQQARAITQSERAQGAAADAELVNQFGGRYEGPQASFVERTGARVAARSGIPNAERDVRVQLLNSPVENAFAVPGGYVYITRQLLALMNSEDELAFVLGHEVGHIAARHSAGRQRTSAIGGVLAGIVGAVAGNSTLGQLVGQGAQTSAQLFGLGYGRNQEYQADQLGVTYMANAGYNPLAAPEALSQLGTQTALVARAEGNNANAVPSWLSTHPSSAERVRRARQLAARARGPSAPPVQQDAAFLRMLEGMRYDEDPQQGVIEGQRFRHPTLRFGFTAPTGFSIVNANDSVTVQGRGGQAQLTIGAAGSNPAAAVAQRFTTLGARIDAGSVRQTTLGGRPAAIATTTAAAGNQRVDATVVATTLPTGTFVWTLATPAGSGVGAFNPLLASFQPLAANEAGSIRGKRVRIHTVRAGDTVDSLSARMAFPTLRRERLVALNGLTENTTLTPGQLVKLVVAD